MVADWNGESFEAVPGGWFDAWSGRKDTAAPRLLGYYNGDRERVLSFERALTPTTQELAGTWSSVSSDYSTPSDPVMVFGCARISSAQQAIQ